MNNLSGFIKRIFPKDKSGPSEIVMDRQLAADYNSTRSIKDHASFCHAPSLNLYFSQNGDVKVCCHNSEFTLGTYPQQNIHEIWHSDRAKELREYMRKFDLSHGCAVCDFDVKLRAFNQVQARHFDPRPRHPDYPTMMEFLISNKCNLECVMCQGEYSSLIRKNRDKLPPLEFPYDHAFIRQLEEFIPHLHEARFSGSGEAFLIDINYEIWEMIIRMNPKCVITVQTNGTILTERAKEILSRGNFQIGVSLDSLSKEIFETIRINSNHHKVMENIRWFSEYSAGKKSYFMLAMCVMRQNWHELPAFINLCNELGAAAVLHKVWSPEEFALHSLSSKQLNEIFIGLKSLTYTAETPLQKQNLEHYHYFASVVKSWMEDAIKKENSITEIKNLNTHQLFALFSKKVRDHIDLINVGKEEKHIITKTFHAKLKKVLEMLEPAEQKDFLRLIYLENPTRIIGPMNQQTDEKLYENAKKFLEREKSIT